MKPRHVLSQPRLESGELWIDAASDEQLEDALQALEGDRPYGYQTRARGGSKTTDLAGCALAVLLATDERLRAYWLAADQDQGRLAIDVIAGFVARTPPLAERVEIQSRRVLVRPSGATLEVLAAEAPSAWGLTPH